MLRAGEGGDDTTAIDAAAEDAVVTRLERSRPTSCSSRRSSASDRSARAARPGSSSTRSTVGEREARDPLLRALPRRRERADDGDVTFGYVYDFGAREEWVPRRVAARAQRRPLAGPRRKSDRDPLLRGDHDRLHRREGSGDARRRGAPAGDGLARPVAVPPRCRQGRRVCSLKPARSIDIAAAQLLVRECGYAIDLFEEPPFTPLPSIWSDARALSRPRPRRFARRSPRRLRER